MENDSKKVAASLADDVLSQANDQTERSQARSDEHATGKTLTEVVVLGVILLGLIGFYFINQPDPGPPLSLQEQRYATLDDMSELVFDLDAYREEHGAVPDDLVLLGNSKYPDLVYRRLDGNHYQVSANIAGRALIYDSDTPAYRFFATVRGIE